MMKIPVSTTAVSSDNLLPPRVKDLTGRVFGLLTVQTFAGKNSAQAATWLCLCDCGKTTTIDGRCLTNKDSRSCGCLRISTSRRVHTKHGECSTDIYNIWKGIKKRTRCPSDFAYPRYGAVGIEMADEFHDSFEAFRDYMGPRPTLKHTVDRIDGTKGYVRGNLRWATYTEQARNRKSNVNWEHKGETLTVAGWGERLCCRPRTLSYRKKSGWSIDKILTTPIAARKKARLFLRGEPEDYLSC